MIGILLSNLVFHGRVLLSYSCQCFTTETFTQDNRGYTTETPSISYISYLYIRLVITFVKHSSHRGGSPQNGLGDERTCGTALASAYVLRHLSAMWLQLQMMGRSPRWK